MLCIDVEIYEDIKTHCTAYCTVNLKHKQKGKKTNATTHGPDNAKVLVVVWMISWQDVRVSQSKHHYLSFPVLALKQRVNSLGIQSSVYDESAHPTFRRVPSSWLRLCVFQFEQADIAGLKGLSHRRAKIRSDTGVCEGNYCESEQG